MLKPISVVLLSAALFWIGAAQARSVSLIEPIATDKKQVDLVIALDVSGSMSGLIESAKQRLWDVVNELGRAQPQPDLRVAIITYGNPSYGNDTGYVKINQPFTRDLDSVNETLFSFQTNGGDEYVARAIDTSVKQLQWSNEPGAVRILFVAGNEPATQDPLISVESAAGLANQKGIVVNTIYCGTAGDEVSFGWARVASLTQGMYASIDQQAAAVANVATPMDKELVKLNQELNETYIAFGFEGEEARRKQKEQDKLTAALSEPAAASRTVTKGSVLYRNSRWDLVDAVKEGKNVEEIPSEDLPENMQAMDVGERDDYVQRQIIKREELQQKIQDLGDQRRTYIAEQKADSDKNGLDDAILEGLRKVAQAQGMELEN